MRRSSGPRSRSRARRERRMRRPWRSMSFFRTSGGFVYTNRPPPLGAVAPLVDFVTRTRAGYCQHFAGAMALMLRYLGVPARVAVGFSSGTYDAKAGVWRVTDHDAHAWVEVWFRGYGWLPFDPTPAARPGTRSAERAVRGRRPYAHSAGAVRHASARSAPGRAIRASPGTGTATCRPRRSPARVQPAEQRRAELARQPARPARARARRCDRR